MWSFENITHSIDTWLYDTFNPTTGNAIRISDRRHLCNWVVCRSWIGSDPDGKKSFCVDADTPGT